MTQTEQGAEKSLESVLKDISKGQGSSCYLLYGDEDFLVEEALGKLVDALVPEQNRDLSLFVMDDESTGVDPVCEALLTPSLIPGPKVVLLPKTRLFYSKTSLPELVRKIADSAEADLPSAARTFMIFLHLSGWTLEQLRDDGWKRLTDEQWRDIAGGAGGEDREKWLPRVVEYCVGQGTMTERHRAGGTDILEELLSSGLPEGHCLVMTADSVDRRKRLFKVVSEKGVVLPFIRTRSEARQRSLMMESLREKLARRGKTLTSEAWIVLGKKTGFRLRDSAEALDQLITYTGDRTVIEPADVETVIGRAADDGRVAIAERVASGATPMVTLHSNTDPGAFLVPLDESSDGTLVVFTRSLSGVRSLYVLSKTDGKVVPYLEDGFDHPGASLSRDGRWLAYTTNESGTYEVVVQPFPDPTQGKWPISTGGGAAPRWRQDGRELFYVNNVAQLVAVPVTTHTQGFVPGTPQPLFLLPGNLPITSTGAYSYDVSPDGQRVLVSLGPGGIGNAMAGIPLTGRWGCK